MQLSKILKKLLIILPIVTITACSFGKKTDNDHKEKSVMNATDTSMISDGRDIPSSKYTHLQIKQLQQDNIIYFDLDKYNIRPDFTAILDAHANLLRSIPTFKIIIEGHTDERGTPEYNIALGERRAKAVKIYLQSKGVHADQISIISYGKEKPAVIGHDESVYAKNRRAVLVY